jgi:hypothetical protein
MAYVGRKLGRSTALGGAILLASACTVVVPLPNVEVDAGADPVVTVDGGVPVDGSTAPQPRDARSPTPADARSDDDAACWQVALSRDMVPPQAIVAFDRSSTMTVRVEALRKELTPLLSALDGAVAFGYIEFPDKACDPSMGCCASSELLIPPAVGTAAAIGKALACDANGRKCVEGPPRTPTDVALDKIEAYFKSASSVEADRFVIMVTDGAPNCGGIGDPCGRARATARDMWQSNLSVKTAILGISPEAHFSCLRGIASEGGNVFRNTPTPFDLPFMYIDDTIVPAVIKDGLTQVLAPIKARACVVKLAGSRDKSDDVVVRANGQTVNFDPNHVDGWDFDDGHSGRQIRIWGPKCNQALSGQLKPQNVQAIVTCSQCGDRLDCTTGRSDGTHRL